MSGYEVFEVVTSEQREQLFRFRYQIFTLEQHKYINTADHERQRLVDGLDEKAVHLCVARNGKIVGSLRQVRGRQHATPAMWRNFSLDAFSEFPDSAFGFSGRLLVLPEYRGSRALMDLILGNYARGRIAGVIFDFIFCNPHLVRLYEQLGYRRYGPYFDDPGLGFQIPQVLVADDVEHLKYVRSPFTPLASTWPTDARHAQHLLSRFADASSFFSPAAMSMEAFVEVLGARVNRNDIPLFEGLAQDEQDEFIELSAYFKLTAGTRLVRRGDLGQELYLILNGVAEVRRLKLDGSQVLLSTLGRGDSFGEMSVLTSKPRSADVIAVSDLEVICIDQSTLRKFIKGKPKLAAKLLYNIGRILANRLEGTFDRLVGPGSGFEVVKAEQTTATLDG